MRKQNGMSAMATWQKLQIFKIQDGGRLKLWKSLNRHISVKNHPIFMKFGTLHQILNPITVTWPNIEIFKIQDGGSRHLKNRFLGHNSSTDSPISAKFCMSKQNGMYTHTTLFAIKGSNDKKQTKQRERSKINHCKISPTQQDNTIQY